MNLPKEIRKISVQDALDVLQCHGEVWFLPGNNGDLGSLMVGDDYVTSIRTYTERHGD